MALPLFSLSDRSPKKKSRSLCTVWLTVIVSLCYREAMITRSLRRLKEQIVRARLLAQEAGFIAEELNKRTEYLVTLQIPAANLDANRKVQQGDVCCFKTNVVSDKDEGFIVQSQQHLMRKSVEMTFQSSWIELVKQHPTVRMEMLTGSRLLKPCLVFLSPQRDAVLSEPAIQVRRKSKGKQIWALEKMENRLVDMRELYQEWKELDEDNPVSGDTN